MLLYKHAEQARLLRAIAERIGFASTGSLKARVLTALARHAATNKEMRIKLREATKLFAGSVTVRNDCFRLWVQVHRLGKRVGASQLRARAAGVRQLKAAVVEAWQRVVVNKKRAMTRWVNGALLWAFSQWAAMVLDVRDFEGQLEGKLGGRLLAAGKVLRALVLTEWRQVANTKTRALRRWTHASLVRMWMQWAGVCADQRALVRQVQDRCKGVAAQLKGAWRDMCFHAWAASVLKDRRARARFVNATLYLCLSSWKTLAAQEAQRRQRLAVIAMRIARRTEILVLQAYRDLVADRARVRRLLARVLALWLDRSRRMALRALSQYAHRRRRHRALVREGLGNAQRWRVRRGLGALLQHRAQQVRVRVVLARIRMRPCAVALEGWNKLVLDVVYAHQRALADKSPVIARFLKRAMVDAFAAWHVLAAEQARQMAVLRRIRARVVYAACITALQRWGVAVELEHAARAAELRAGVAAALGGGDLVPLQRALASQLRLPHVRRSFGGHSLRAAVAHVLAAEGASRELVHRLVGGGAGTSGPQVGGAAIGDGLEGEAEGEGNAAWSAVPVAEEALGRGLLDPQDERESVARYMEMESRRHLQAAFADTMRMSVVMEGRQGNGFGERGGGAPRVRLVESRAGVGARRDGMGELMQDRERERERREGIRVFPKARRLATASAEPTGAGGESSTRCRTALKEEQAHADATQWVLGVVPPTKLPRPLGVGRLHADAYHASMQPVPVTDLNVSSLEARLGARYRIWDVREVLPARIIRNRVSDAPCPAPESAAKARHLPHPRQDAPRSLTSHQSASNPIGLDDGHSQWQKTDEEEQTEETAPGGDGGKGRMAKRSKSALSAADLLAVTEHRYVPRGAGHRRTKGGGHEHGGGRSNVLRALGHFRAVLGIPDPRVSVPARTKSACGNRDEAVQRELLQTPATGIDPSYSSLSEGYSSCDDEAGELMSAVSLPRMHTARSRTQVMDLNREDSREVSGHRNRYVDVGRRGGKQSAGGKGLARTLPIVGGGRVLVSAAQKDAFDKSQRLFADVTAGSFHGWARERI